MSKICEVNKGTVLTQRNIQNLLFWSSMCPIDVPFSANQVDSMLERGMLDISEFCVCAETPVEIGIAGVYFGETDCNAHDVLEVTFTGLPRLDDMIKQYD